MSLSLPTQDCHLSSALLPSKQLQILGNVCSGSQECHDLMGECVWGLLAE